MSEILVTKFLQIGIRSDSVSSEHFVFVNTSPQRVAYFILLLSCNEEVEDEFKNTLS
jgi:hypothetical protein